MDREVDELLRQNAERQLAGFDWDEQRRTVMDRLAAGRTRRPQRMIAIKVAAGVAAVLVLVAGYVGAFVLHSPDRDAGEPIETAAVKESVENDDLLASTDPTTILLTGPVQLLALNDPTLTPPASRQP